MAVSVEKKVTIFFVFGLVILGLLLQAGEKWQPFRKNVRYQTFLTSVTGLKVGDPVRLSGVDVGTVDDIVILSDRIEIVFDVKPGTLIKADTVAELRHANLLGGQFLALSFGSVRAETLPPGSTVPGRDVANIDIIVDQVSDLAKGFKTKIITLNKDQADMLQRASGKLDGIRGDLRNNIANLNKNTEQLDRGNAGIAQLWNDKKLYTDISRTVENLSAAAGGIDRGEGTFGKMVNDDAPYRDTVQALSDMRAGVKNVNASIRDFSEGTAGISRGEGSFGKLVQDETVFTQWRNGSKNIAELAQKANSGQGTIGRLVHDEALYRDAAAALKKTGQTLDKSRDTDPVLSVIGNYVGTIF